MITIRITHVYCRLSQLESHMYTVDDLNRSQLGSHMYTVDDLS